MKAKKTDRSPGAESLDPSWIIEDLKIAGVYRSIEPVLGKAVIDPDFRQRLKQNPAAAVEPYDLNQIELGWLRQIDSKLLDQTAEEVRDHFSETSNPLMPLALSMMLAELLWGPD